tara:strand:+ start:1019 stop:1285 length:267 start_codon:yes stop_codon:yes gene_type:complete
MNKEDIQKFIDETVNPGLEGHSGNVLIHDFDDKNNNLKVKMGGSCQGCASSKFTLVMMVERSLKEEFPDLGNVEDVTDHAAGKNPYYY